MNFDCSFGTLISKDLCDVQHHLNKIIGVFRGHCGEGDRMVLMQRLCLVLF